VVEPSCRSGSVRTHPGRTPRALGWAWAPLALSGLIAFGGCDLLDVFDDEVPACDPSPAGASEHFVDAVVDGSRCRAPVIVTRGATGTLQIQARVNSSANHPSVQWDLTVPNAVGTHPCSPAGSVTAESTTLSVVLGHGEAARGGSSTAEGGTCSIIVTQAAANDGDAIEGTFSGRLRAPNPMQTSFREVTDGTFRARRSDTPTSVPSGNTATTAELVAVREACEALCPMDVACGLRDYTTIEECEYVCSFLPPTMFTNGESSACAQSVEARYLCYAAAEDCDALNAAAASPWTVEGPCAQQRQDAAAACEGVTAP